MGMDHSYRGVKLGANSALMTAAVILIVGVVYALAARKPVQHDFSKEKINTLSKETVTVAKELDAKNRYVFATAFFKSNTFEFRQVKDLLTEVKRRSRHFNFRMVDTVQEPGVARQLGMDETGIVFESGQPNTRGYKKKKVYSDELFEMDPSTMEASSFNGEQAVVNALIAVALKKEATVCFSMGNGELRSEDTTEAGLSEIADALEKNAYAISYADLSKEKDVPPECRVLISPAPFTAFSPGERAMLDRFIKRGGGVLLMIDMLFPEAMNKTLGAWGLAMDKTMIRDPERKYDQQGDNLKPVFLEHKITEGLSDEKTGINMPGPQTLRILSRKPAGVRVTPLLETSPAALAMPYMITQDALLANPEKAEQGVQKLGAAVEIGKKGRAVVLTDVEFAANAYVDTAVTFSRAGAQTRSDAGPGNADFLVNCVNWLSGEEDLITLRPRTAENRPLTMDPQIQSFYFNVFTFLVPLGILLLGGMIWHWRRSL